MSGLWKALSRGVGDARDADDDHPDRGESIARLAALAWRHRAVTGPLAVGAAVGLAGKALHTSGGMVLTVLAALTGAAGAAGWAAARLSSTRERRIIYTAAPAAAVWIMAAAALGPATPALLWSWAAGTAAGTAAWGWHRRTRRRQVQDDGDLPKAQRRRRRRHVARYLESWPWVTDAAGMPGSELVDVTATRYGWTARVRLPAGATFEQFIRVVPAIESHYDLPEDAMQVERDSDRRRRRAVLRVIETDPHADPIACPGPSISRPDEPVPVGLYADGTPKALAMFGDTGARQGVAAGIQGSGKSSLPNRLLVDYAPLPTVAVILVDLKGGQEFGPWRQAATLVVTTTAQAQTTARGLRDIVTARGQRAQGRTWAPTPGEPAILVICDEAAEMPKGADDDLESITRRGRSVGVATLWLTQYATADAISSQITANCNIRASFRSARKGHGNIALSRLQGVVDTSAIPPDREGTCYLETPEEAREAPLRIEWTGDELIARVVRDSSPTPLSRRDAELLAAASGDSTGDQSGDSSRDRSGDSDDDPELYPIPDDVPLSRLARPDEPRPSRPRLSSAEARALIERTFDESQGRVITPRELREATGYKDSWLHKQLDELEADGRIVWVTRGEYRQADNTLVST